MITPTIDYQKIVVAQKYYELHGYIQSAVPWILNKESYYATKPKGSQDFYCLNGYLNASGEQSFIQNMLDGQNIEKNYCITPCFRQEEVFDDIHFLHFEKLELINTEVSEKNLDEMISVAENFFNQYLPEGTKCKRVAIDNGEKSIDLVDETLGIELGSYGVRRYKDLDWIYGTGLALPRLDIVINKINNLNK